MRYLIRRLVPPHCARGPRRCGKCRDAKETYLLLDIAPERPNEIARPVIEVDGTFRPFDVVRRFETREEALAYAQDKGIRADL